PLLGRDKGEKEDDSFAIVDRLHLNKSNLESVGTDSDISELDREIIDVEDSNISGNFEKSLYVDAHSHVLEASDESNAELPSPSRESSTVVPVAADHDVVPAQNTVLEDDPSLHIKILFLSIMVMFWGLFLGFLFVFFTIYELATEAFQYMAKEGEGYLLDFQLIWHASYTGSTFMPSTDF
ncbi:hypothetical protein H0H93_010120, partial [Arthromyces matolae]